MDFVLFEISGILQRNEESLARTASIAAVKLDFQTGYILEVTDQEKVLNKQQRR